MNSRSPFLVNLEVLRNRLKGTVGALQTYLSADSRTWIFFLFVWGVILTASGAVTSGYHFIDDHEIIRFSQELSDPNSGLLDVIKTRLSSDLSVRFRPLYYIHRIVITAVLGINFLAWQLYVLFLSTFCCYFFYLFCKKSDFSTAESILFSILIFAGEQSEIWWRLGPAETIGIFLLSVSMLCMAKSVLHEDKRPFFEFFFILFALLASLCKESFILILPALALWKTLLWKKRFRCEWKQAVRENVISVLSLLIIASADILVVHFLLEKKDIGYAGMEPIHFSTLLHAVKSLLLRNGLGVLAFLSFAIVLFSQN